MNEKKARALLYERSNRACEMCDRAPATEAHHRKNRSQGGRWSPENLIHVCHSCHVHVTTNPAAAREQGWAVGRNFTPAEVPVWIAGRGRVLLDASGGVTPTEKRAA
jgi:HNH endonuclease